ncbi:MAG: hypothetical protein E6230_15320 [Paenibacillus dendritiformis]|uniref:hypothetical protein n=1 Tax=Paenibacillus dendritiformis TaxID=130049 RepID=UPI001B1B61E7|nr:hypothetical protein [Paenibacillus dendritiformis]MDU5143548.1 hypothetical protein [Paenibacillus dendritiformis]GIO71309.1 hypothetical protein J27TS7_08230 [Paenibacillus dendritiformis]
MNQKPSIGRIVHFVGIAPRAAIITGVVDDETVHLCIFNPAGIIFAQNVKRGDDYDQWNWPPRV